MANLGFFLFIFVLFSLQFQKYELKKVYMLCLELEPTAAEW